MKPDNVDILLNLDSKSTDLLRQIYEYLVDSGARHITAQIMLDCLKDGLARQGYSWSAFPPSIIKWVERGVKGTAKDVLKRTNSVKTAQATMFEFPETFTVRFEGGYAHVPYQHATEQDIMDHLQVQEDHIEDAQRSLAAERDMYKPVLMYMRANRCTFGEAIAALGLVG